MNLASDINRIRKDIVTISGFNSTPGEGTTRFSYSQEDRKARDYVIGEMKALGLKVTVDPIGNIRGRMSGLDDSLPVIMTGSHIDTVTNGGDFDGVAGVIAALEMMRVFKENNLKPVSPVELIVFVEEEGPQFGFPLAGSRILTGQYLSEEIKGYHNKAGESMYDAALKFGLNPDHMANYVLMKEDIQAMIELHIEQSVVLDELKLPVGIVEAVFGRQWVEVTINGKSNHAGATPMQFRNDAMAGAASIISQIGELARAKGSETAVATVGRIHCTPNEPNVIPEKVVFTVDIRDKSKNSIEGISKGIRELTAEIGQEMSLDYKVEKLSETAPIILSENVVSVIEKEAIRQKINHIRMNSGALHDSCLMAGITQVGMIFVPSIAGRSHCPQEDTRFEDLKIGTDLLIGAVSELSGISLD
jgi:allantoate deiminase